jgi:hypothetical protein
MCATHCLPLPHTCRATWQPRAVFGAVLSPRRAIRTPCPALQSVLRRSRCRPVALPLPAMAAPGSGRVGAGDQGRRGYGKKGVKLGVERGLPGSAPAFGASASWEPRSVSSIRMSGVEIQSFKVDAEYKSFKPARGSGGNARVRGGASGRTASVRGTGRGRGGGAARGGGGSTGMTRGRGPAAVQETIVRLLAVVSCVSILFAPRGGGHASP